MKRIRDLVILFIVFCTFFGVTGMKFAPAGKPKPPPTATPPVSYPGPSKGEPAPMLQAYPSPPTEAPPSQPQLPQGNDPRPLVPYAWGIFLHIPNVGYNTFMSVDGFGMQEVSYGSVCIWNGFEPPDCIHLNWFAFEPVIDRNWYGGYARACGGDWFIWTAHLVLVPVQPPNIILPADIRQPNTYKIHCIFLPGLEKG